MSLKLLAEVLATQCFFIDHLKNKTVNKATSITKPANHLEICAHYLENFPTGFVIFRGS